MITDQFKRPLRDLRISVIDRCNFRCPYCMPAEQYHHAYQFLEKHEWLTFDEIERIARISVKLGVTKLRLTGGEPLLRPSIDALIQRLVGIEGVDDVALTTNGSLLRECSRRLKSAGLKRLTISLDSLDPKIFDRLSGGRAKLTDVLDGIKSAEDSGFNQMKINAVLVRGVNDGGIMELVRYFKNSGHTLRFIEYMDVGNQNDWDINQVVTSSEVLKVVSAEMPLKRMGGTEDGGTAERYAFEDGTGEIELISSISKAFCGTCSRMRVSADGKIYTCLFASKGTDLKSLLRAHHGDEAVLKMMTLIWSGRHDRYSKERDVMANKTHPDRVEMFHIGG